MCETLIVNKHKQSCLADFPRYWGFPTTRVACRILYGKSLPVTLMCITVAVWHQRDFLSEIAMQIMAAYTTTIINPKSTLIQNKFI